MKTYKRTLFSLIKGVILAPFTGLFIFIIAQILLPVPVCAVLGVAAAAIIVYISVFSENIYFELDDDGTFRYFKMGTLKNTIKLSDYRIGYYRKTERGIFGLNNIALKLFDSEDQETNIEAGPLGTTQFDKMFAEMEKFAIKDIETLDPGKK